MLTGNSVIIHSSTIVQLGLKNILLSRGIGIGGIMPTFPGVVITSEWKGLLILAGTQFSDELKNRASILRKNGNTLIGIDTTGRTWQPDPVFDGIIGINDSLDTINRIAADYFTRTAAIKSDNQLSHREIEVLTMVAQGFSNKQIADQLFISIHTVITHRKNITSKLGIKSIPGLTLYAALNNLVEFQR
jgi:DNA-binding CsgD family transcriptional regulator